jgi:hypothetical protein
MLFRRKHRHVFRHHRWLAVYPPGFHPWARYEERCDCGETRTSTTKLVVD